MISEEFQKRIDKITECLNQKVVLLTKIVNITKQIEVQSKNEDMFLDDLLVERGSCIERFNRCNLLVKQQAELIKLDDSLFFEQLTRSLLGEDTGVQELMVLTELTRECSDLYARSKEINAQAQKNLVEQYENMKNELNEQRRKNGTQGGNLFHS